MLMRLCCILDEDLNEYSEELTKLCGFTETNGLLIVTKNNEYPFFMDGLYITQARNQLDQGSVQVRGFTQMGKSKLNIDHFTRLLFAIFCCKRDKEIWRYL
ncbi:hypothetical protein [Wolbachia endosymbiont of Mansonella ozzardi]|uniref:hypothetical protein n=1 Tax=Wolbachia endosymbiont of Mansonella ozzardi TaxID=137464 RepID=UPI0034D00E0F